MALTITNTNTIQLLSILNRNTAAQANTLRQLTTGRRINTGKDDPAGLIALSLLNAERTAVVQSLSNNQRTDAILTVADSAFEEIAAVLSEIESLVVASTSDANLSAAEIAANQSQIDDALTAIDRIVSTTNFNGKKLLDGSFSIQTTGVAGNSNLSNVRVFSRSQATSNTTLTVDRVASAQLATAMFATMDQAATTRTDGTTEVVIQGALGAATLTIASSLTQAQVVAAINGASGQTGVSAIQNAGDITLNSTTYGTDAFVSVQVLSGGTINSSYGTATDDGDTTNDIAAVSKTTGADATININGQNAATDGLDVVYSANGLSLSFTLGTDFGRGSTAAQTSFTVLASGGATFQLGTTADTRQTIGIDSLATFNLGGGNATARLSELKSGGSVDVDSNPGGALSTVREAISDLASIRGRIGGFQKFQVGSAIHSLEAANIGLTQAASVIGDTDFALATARLSQQTVLIQAGISLLGVANQQAAQILSLL